MSTTYTIFLLDGMSYNTLIILIKYAMILSLPRNDESRFCLTVVGLTFDNKGHFAAPDWLSPVI